MMLGFGLGFAGRCRPVRGMLVKGGGEESRAPCTGWAEAQGHAAAA